VLLAAAIRAVDALAPARGTKRWEQSAIEAMAVQLSARLGTLVTRPLSRTPLGPLLSGSPDFNGKAEILPSADSRVVVARAKNSGQYGQLTLAFLRNGSAPGGLQLYGWTAIDPQNHRTTVKLSDVRFNVAVPESAFTYAEPKKKR